MKTTALRSHRPDKLPGRFIDLVAMHPPRVLHDEADYDNAIKVIDRLTSVPRLTKGQSDYLETLAILVESYEREHYPIDTSDISQLEMLRFLCDQSGMSASALGELLGNRSLGSKLLRGERELSKNHIRILCERFHVSADLFIRSAA